MPGNEEMRQLWLGLPDHTCAGAYTLYEQVVFAPSGPSQAGAVAEVMGALVSMAGPPVLLSCWKYTVLPHSTWPKRMVSGPHSASASKLHCGGDSTNTNL